MHDIAVAEFDARLHDKRDDARKCIAEAARREGLAVDVMRPGDRVRPGDLEMVEVLHRAAGHGDLRADHIDRRQGAAGIFFGGCRKRAARSAVSSSASATGSPRQPIEVSRCSLVKPAAA